MDQIKKQKNNDPIKARVFEMKGLVNYQAGSIVSREVINRKAGTVTVFAFDEGQQLSEHTAPYDAMIFGLDGEAEIFVAGEPNRIKESDMIIVPADIPHSVKAFSRFKMMLIMIRK